MKLLKDENKNIGRGLGLIEKPVLMLLMDTINILIRKSLYQGCKKILGSFYINSF